MSVVGKFYCNNSPSQGNSCIEIIDANHSIYSNPAHPVYPAINQVWIPGVPTLMAVDTWDNMVNTLPPDQIPVLYNTKENCETDCSNHYVHNCWDYDNGSTVVGQNSFYHLTTSQKNIFCRNCFDDTGSTVIKDHPYCWCINPQNGGTHLPFGSTWTRPPKAYTCNPKDSDIDLETIDSLSKNLFLTIKIPIGNYPIIDYQSDELLETKDNIEINFESTGLIQPINTVVKESIDSEFISTFNNEVFVGNNKIGRYTITAIDNYFFKEAPSVNILASDGFKYDITKLNPIYNDYKQLISITFDVSYNCSEDDDNFIHDSIDFTHSLFTDRGVLELEKAIYGATIPNEYAPMTSGGANKKIKIKGTPGARFTLTIDDSSGCSILEEELEDITIPVGGSYYVNQVFPSIDSSLKSDSYTVNLSTPADTTNYWPYYPEGFVLRQLADPIITITNTTSQTGPALDVSGDDITFTNIARKYSGLGENLQTYSLIITENSPTAGYFYVTNDNPFRKNATNNMVIKKIVSNENTIYAKEDEASEIRLKPKTTRIDSDGSITGEIKKGMYFNGEMEYTKTVKASIGKTGCSDLTDKFTLTDTRNLFEGMLVRGDRGVATSIVSIDNETDVTFSAKQIIKNESILTFRYEIGGLVFRVVDPIDKKGECHVHTGNPNWFPKNMELTFYDDHSQISDTTIINGSGTDRLTLKAYINVLSQGEKDVTYTLNLDNFITRKPNAYDQTVFATKNTSTIINVKMGDTDLNAKDKVPSFVKSPSHGTVTVGESAPYLATYTPYNRFAGEDTFTFTVSDGTTSSDERRVFITVK